MKPLRAKHIFVDTSVFRSLNLDFETKELVALRDMCSAGELTLIMPEITEREVFSQLAQRAHEIASDVARLKNKAHQLSAFRPQSGGKSIFSHNQDDFEAELGALFETYLTTCKAVSLPVPSDVHETVIENYFLGNSPFSEPKKKDEFPDAFTCETINRFSETKKVDVYIVSKDGDIKRYCEHHTRLLFFETLSEALDSYNSHKELSQFVVKELTTRLPTLRDTVAGLVAAARFKLYDSDAAVTDVVVHDIKFEQVYVISVSDGSAVANIFFLVRVTAKAIVQEIDSTYTGPEGTRSRSRILNLDKRFLMGATLEVVFEKWKTDSVKTNSVELTAGNYVFPYNRIQMLLESRRAQQDQPTPVAGNESSAVDEDVPF